MPQKWLIRGVIAGLVALLVSACSMPRPGEAKIPDGAKVTHRAVFIGKNYHDAVGTISLYQSDEPAVIVLEPNFSLSGPKDAVVTLGRDGAPSKAGLGPLLRNSGRQAYAVPEGVRVELYNEVWLWSDTRGIPLGLARFVPI